MSNVDQGLKDMVSVLQVHAEAVSAVSVNQELLATLRIISLHIRHNWNPVPSDIRYIKSLADEAIRKAERAL